MSWSIRYLSAILVGLALTSPTFAASVDYKVRNAPGASTADTYLAIRNEIAKAAVEKRDVYSSNTTLERRWVDATFLKLGHERTAGEIQARPIDVGGMVDITCTECYILGSARAHVNISVADPGAHILQVTSNFTSDVQNLTNDFQEYTVDYLGNYFTQTNFGGIMENLVEDGPQWEDLELPTFNYTMDLDIPEIPECTLKFEFDGLELYMDMNAVLEAGATYELPLYRSQTLAGLYITQNLNLGVFFTVDLILSVEGEIDISSGFHIKMDDGIAIEITLFGDAVSDIKMPGGQFEFLPVVVESGGMVFSSVLRLGIFAGFQLATPQLKTKNPVALAVEKVMPDVSGGIEVGIFANVAEFITNITFTPEEECKRNVVQSYQLALGAKAGATVAIGNNTWGPVPETSVPVWYTEMASVCAGEKPSTPATAASGIITTAPEDRKRQDLTTTTITKEFIHTGVNCLDVGLINCPANRQNTSQSTETRTIVTAVPSGMRNIAFPTTVMDSVPSTIAFRRNAETIPPIAGSPTSWVPPPPTSTGKFEEFVDDVQDAADDAIEDAKDTFQKAKNNKPLIIGLSVGVGAPILLGMLAGLLVLYRRRQSDISARGAYANPDTAPMMVQTPGQTPMTPGYPSPNLMSGYQDYKAVKGATVEEKEIKSPGGSSGGSSR